MYYRNRFERSLASNSRKFFKNGIVCTGVFKFSKKYITVQESFVYDLNQQKLKNNGVNRNQMFKIFWSNNANCEIPDFDAEISDVHPPLAENACYSGRLYKFYGTYFSFYFVFYEIAK